MNEAYLLFINPLKCYRTKPSIMITGYCSIRILMHLHALISYACQMLSCLEFKVATFTKFRTLRLLYAFLYFVHPKFPCMQTSGSTCHMENNSWYFFLGHDISHCADSSHLLIWSFHCICCKQDAFPNIHLQLSNSQLLLISLLGQPIQGQAINH